MTHTRKIGAHHALMGITMLVFAVGATALGPKFRDAMASSEAISAKQRDAFIVQCKDQYIEKLTSALSQATNQPGVRRALEGYWKEVNMCVLREVKNSRTGSGSDVRKEQSKKAGFSKVSPVGGMLAKYGPTNFYWMGTNDSQFFQYYVEIYNADGALPALHKASVTKGEGNKFFASIDLSKITGVEKGKKYTWQVFASDGKNQQIADNGEKAKFVVGDVNTATGSTLGKPAASSESEMQKKEKPAEKPEFKFRNAATPKPGETPKPKPTHNGVDTI